jgi:hypothetical protein
MHIAKIEKQTNQIVLTFYDKDLNILEDESFPDVSSLNFFLQTLPRKYNVQRTLLVVLDVRTSKMDMQIAISENSYFIT